MLPDRIPRTLDLARDFGPQDAAAWRSLVDTDLQGAPFERKLVSRTYEGIAIQPLYTERDWPGTLDAARGVSLDPSGVSGFMPMTRGARVLGGSQHGWTIRQERAEPGIAEFNAATLEDLAGGVASVLIRFDACARAGLDPDDAGGVALSGRDGLAAYSVADLEAALAGVFPGMIEIALEAGAAFAPAAALLAAYWSRTGVVAAHAHGAFNADPLAVLARDGHLPYTLDAGLASLGELAAWTSRTYPRSTSVRVGTAPYHHAGATATQDLAFSMATALEYLRAMERAGLGVDAAAKQIQFSYAVGCGFFLAIAKLRAARRLWARVVEACGGGLDARRMRVHARTSKRVLTSRDPWVNILRNSASVFAAGVAGVDSIGSEPFDAPLSHGTPSRLARRVARNTHHILMEECHLHRVSDPAGGSSYLEHLTDAVADGAWTLLQEIESRGGMAHALSDGWIASQIKAAYEPRVKNIATRKDPVLGVSEFPLAHEAALDTPQVDRAQIAAVAAARVAQQREQGPSLASVLAAMHAEARGETHAARGRTPLDMAGLVEMARRGTTIGTLMSLATHDDHADVRAGARITEPVTLHPFAEPFERLREAADEYAHAAGARPRVFLASVGTPAQHLARTTYARNLFEAGGFEVCGMGEDAMNTPSAEPRAGAASGYASAEAAANAYASQLSGPRSDGHGAHVAVICASDEQYPTLVPALAPLLHARGARRVILAGNPGAHEAAYRDAGVDRFVFVRCDVVSLLREMLIEEGVTP
jgi:methylmalonyl-CoA mutase